MNFLDYCFYRISKGYQSAGEKNTDLRGWGAITFIFTGYTCLLLSLFGVKIDGYMPLYIFVVLGVAFAFIFNRSRYERLKEQRANVKEKYSKIKYLLIELFFLSACIAYWFSLVISN